MANPKRAKLEISKLASNINIFDLDDDCLEHIFKWLPTYDLCSVFKTCLRFQRVADLYFETYRSKNLKIKLSKWLDAQREIIMCFGQHIRKMEINVEHDLNGDECFFGKLWPIESTLAIIESRTNGKLNQLKLCNLIVNATFVDKIKNILKYVQDLYIDYCIINGCFYELVMKNCENLKYLIIDDYDNKNDSWLLRKYPQLNAITFILSKPSDEVKLQSLFDQNTNIKKLTLRSFLSCYIRLLPKWIIRNSTKVKEINLRTKSNNLNADVEKLCELGIVKDLHIVDSVLSTDEEVEFINRVAKYNTFERFGFSFSEENLPDEFLRAVAQLTNLKVLTVELPHTLHEQNISRISKMLSCSLIHLEELRIMDGVSITSEDVCLFIESFPKMKKLVVSGNITFSEMTTKDDLSLIVQKRAHVNGACPLVISAAAFPCPLKNCQTIVLNVPNGSTITIKKVRYKLPRTYHDVYVSIEFK